MNLTREKYQEYQELALHLKFEMNDISYTPYEVAIKQCNGIGPEWFPAILRKLIDALNPHLIIVSINHDLNWSKKHKQSTKYFHASNKAFETNGKKVAEYVYKWYDPRRYWVTFKSKDFHIKLDKFGGLAYKNACEKIAEEQA